MVKFAYTILYVQNVTTSIEFYEKAFGFSRKFITPQNDYGELLVGETSLAFTSIDLVNTNISGGFQNSSLTEKQFGMEIGLTTDNIEETMRVALEAGARLLEKPTQKPWGQTVAYLRDLDGFLVEVCTPMG